MIIEIDLNKIQEFNISLNQYLFIKTLRNPNQLEGIKSFATSIISDNEVKDLIAMLNHYIEYRTGKPYIILAEPLIHPAVNISIDFLEVEKIRSAEQNGDN